MHKYHFYKIQIERIELEIVLVTSTMLDNLRSLAH